MLLHKGAVAVLLNRTQSTSSTSPSKTSTGTYTSGRVQIRYETINEEWCSLASNSTFIFENKDGLPDFHSKSTAICIESVRELF